MKAPAQRTADSLASSSGTEELRATRRLTLAVHLMPPRLKQTFLESTWVCFSLTF